MANSVGAEILEKIMTDTEQVVEAVYAVLVGSWPGKTFVALYVAIVGYRVLMGFAGFFLNKSCRPASVTTVTTRNKLLLLC